MNNSNKFTQVVIDSKGFIPNETPIKKTVLICANGLQTTDTHDATGIKDYFTEKFQADYLLCEIATVLLFKPGVTKTHRHKKYESILKSAIEEYIKKGYDIILTGYSFSCALVSKMACIYQKHVLKVILVAPIYDTILNNMIPAYLSYARKFSKMNKKYGKRISKAMGRQTVKGMVGLLFSILVSVLQNRKYIRKLKTDSFIIRGTADEMCSLHAFEKIKTHLEGNYQTALYEKMAHTILKSVRFNGIVYEDILSFAFNTPHLIPRSEENFTKVTASENQLTIPDIYLAIDPDSNNDLLASENEL